MEARNNRVWHEDKQVSVEEASLFFIFTPARTQQSSPCEPSVEPHRSDFTSHISLIHLVNGQKPSKDFFVRVKFVHVDFVFSIL